MKTPDDKRSTSRSYHLDFEFQRQDRYHPHRIFYHYGPATGH